jgi:hypothetical protein
VRFAAYDGEDPANSNWRKSCISLGMERVGRNFDRRTFFGSAIGAAALAGAAASAETDVLPRPAETHKGDVPYRGFGKTGETVSVIG